MNTLETLGTALAAAGLATAAFAAPLPGFNSSLVPNLLGTPNDGMVCRSGYTAAFTGTALKCSKTSSIVVNLVCTEPSFTTYVSRAAGTPGSPEGLDVCARDTVVITSTSNLLLLTKGTDYKFAKADAVKITEKTTSRDLEEAAAIGGAATDVETEGGEPVVNTATGDSKDNAKVTLTHFTFPVRTGGIIIVGP